MSTKGKIGAVVAAIAVMFGAASSAALAQQPPFSAYGTGVPAGATVAASIGGVVCGQTTASAAGEWLLQIGADAPCNPTAGAQITFTLNGQPTTATETWQPGGAPANVAQGIQLTAAPATPTPPITPPVTGNAGLLASSGSSTTWLLASLAVIAGGALVLGARTVTARSR